MTTLEFSAMVQKYQSLVYTVCHQLVPDAGDAQDLTQETFLAALTAARPGLKNSGWHASLPTRQRTICAAHGCAG